MIKITKTILLFTITLAFTTISLNVNAKDCSEYQFLSHKYNMCKLGNLKEKTMGSKKSNTSSETKKTSNKEKISGSSDKVKKNPEFKFKPLNNLLKKIKNFGGEKVGEPD